MKLSQSAVFVVFLSCEEDSQNNEHKVSCLEITILFDYSVIA